MQIDPRRLLVLRAVRRTGSVLAASRALHVTPSGVSQQIARLEQETGLALLDRTYRGGGRTVRLTVEGLAMAVQADALADTLTGVEREVDRLKGRTHGIVRVGGFASALNQLVVSVIGQLALTDPSIETHVIEVDDAAGLKALRAGDLDLLISERGHDAGVVPPTLVEEDLLRDPYHVVVPQMWTTPDTAEGLLAGPWVAAPKGQGSRQALERLCANAGQTLNEVHSCTDSRTMVALVANGLGAAVVPDLTLSHLPADGIRVSVAALEPGSRLITLVRRDSAAENSPSSERVRTQLHLLANSRVPRYDSVG